MDTHYARNPLSATGQEMTPYFVGTRVLCRGQPGTIFAFSSGGYLSKEGYASSGGVTIMFEVDDEQVKVQYSSLGKGKGGARLQRQMPSLRPPCRAGQRVGYSEELKQRVNQTYHIECATSPHMSDMRRKRLAKNIYAHAQALVILSGLEDIFKAHLKRCPQDRSKISLSGFQGLKPWYAIFGERLTCLCRWCENFSLYSDVLRVIASYLEPLLDGSCGSDGESEAEGDAESDVPSTAMSLIAKLVSVSKLKSKTEFVEAFLCGNSLRDAAKNCYSSKCSKCGFANFWHQLRAKLVDSNGNPLPSMDRVWLTKMKWERLKSGERSPAAVDGQVSVSDEKEVMREACEGTMIDALDDFVLRVMGKFPLYRKTLQRQKESDQEFDDNMPPLLIAGDSDYKYTI